MHTSDEYQDDLKVPTQLPYEPPIADGAVQHPPGLPRPSRHRSQRQPNLPALPPATHEVKPHGTTRHIMHVVAVHHVTVKNGALQVYDCVHEEGGTHTVANPNTQT